MKTLQLIALFILSLPVFGQVDYSVESLGITYPLGAYIKGEYGYSLEFWRDSDIFYGFVRPSVSAKSSGIINTAAAKIEVYPISILGLYAERSNSSRKSKELPTFDCGILTCENSNIERTTYGFRFALKVGSFFIMSDTKRVSLNLKGNPSGEIADEQTTLIAKSGGDRSLQSLVSAGFDVDGNFSIGLLYKHSEMERYRNQTNLGVLYGKTTFGDNSLLVGAGAFRDRNAHLHPTVLLIFKWVGSKGLLLF